jgi:hypothetical protein
MSKQVPRKEIGPETAQAMRSRDPSLWKVLLESLDIGFGSASMSFQGLHEIILGYLGLCNFLVSRFVLSLSLFRESYKQNLS